MKNTAICLDMKLGELLKMEPLKQIRVIAGQGGLDRLVREYKWMNSPEMLDGPMRDEMVLMGSTVYKSCPNIMEELIRKGACGLAVCKETEDWTFPTYAKELANDKNFPLLELPAELNLIKLKEEVFQYTSIQKSVELQKSREIHKRFTEIVMEGKGLSSIAQALCEITGNPILIEDMNLKNIVSCAPAGKEQSCEKLLAARMSESYKTEFRKDEYYTVITRNNANHIGEGVLGALCADYADVPYRIAPVISNNVLFGFITVVELFHRNVANLEDFALEHAATTIALDLLRDKVIYEIRMRNRRDLMESILDGDVKANLDSGSHLESHFNLSVPAVAIAVEVRGQLLFGGRKEGRPTYRGYKSESEITTLIEGLVFKRDPAAFVHNEDRWYYIFYHHKNSGYAKETRGDILDLCQQIYDRIRMLVDEVQIKIGVGGIYKEPDQLKKSYAEAQQSLKIGKMLMKEENIFFYNDLGIYRFLFMIDKKREMLTYALDQLGPLLNYDQKEGEGLSQICRAFLENNCNITKTAKMISMHPNTLAYKIKKAESILEREFDDYNVRLNIMMAFEIIKIYGK